MIREIFFYALVVANLANMVHLGFFIVGGNVYDIRQFNRARNQKKQPRRSGRKPLVSVVIPAHNESAVIKRTLNSVLASDYPNLEVIVVDDGSKDDTANIVHRYIERMPKIITKTNIGRSTTTLKLTRRYERKAANNPRVRLVVQKNMGKAAAMNNAIQNHVRGSLVMCLDADSLIHVQATRRAVKYFEDPTVVGVAANVRVIPSKNWIGILQRFEHMIGYRSKKFYTVSNSEFIVGGVASTYRTSVLGEVGFYDTDTTTEDIGLSMKIVAQKGNRDSRIIYAADVVAMTEGVQTFSQLFKQRYRWKVGSLQNLIKYSHLIGNSDSKYSKMLTYYRLPVAVFGEIMLLIEPLLLGYVVYLSIAYHTAALLLGAYFTVTLYVLWAVWPDEHLSKKQKLQMSLQALFIYLLFYAMDIIQVTAIFKCLKNRKAIINRTTKSTWVSPSRSGQTAVAIV